MSGQVFWITGFSGAGKTTIGTRLYYQLKKQSSKVVILDGDIIKRLFGAENVDYTREGRKKRAFQYSELCRLLAYQGITVICCTIAMFDEVRDWNRRHIPNYYEIFIDVEISELAYRDAKGLYGRFGSGKDAMVGVADEAEIPKNPDVVIRNSMYNDIEWHVQKILQKTAGKRQTKSSYWDDYYESGLAANAPSDFARFAHGYMMPEKKLADLGCGNGRDSVFFCRQGLKVTAIDRSYSAIAAFDESLPIFAVCDDFVTAKALFCVDYNYCYARWSIHAINQAQQDELFPNVYNALTKGGLFFIEARTINDAKFGKGRRLGVNEFFLDDHYRRFIDPNELTGQLKQLGFEVIFCEQSDNFSPAPGDVPTLVRIVAKK